MSDAMVPSWRPLRRESTAPWRLLAAAGGLLTVLLAGGAIWWGWQTLSIRTVPVVEADPRPFKVRPGDPGGLRVPNQGELVLERPGQRNQSLAQAGRPGAVVPEAEAPNVNGLRAAVTPPPAAIAPVAPPTPAPAPAPAPAAATPRTAPAPTPAAAAPAAAPPARPAIGRVQVQLGALTSEEAARAEWERLQRRAPELLHGRSPQVSRLEREGQGPLFRLRTGGFADQDAAREFCEQLRGRGGACVPVRV
jgi:cell division septation protein DedD